MDNKDDLNKLVSTNPFGCQLSPGDKNALLFLGREVTFLKGNFTTRWRSESPSCICLQLKIINVPKGHIWGWHVPLVPISIFLFSICITSGKLFNSCEFQYSHL